MPRFIKKIHYKYPNIGYFPSFKKLFLHGFSWGKNSGNMQFSLGNPVDVRMNVQKFLDTLKMGKINDSVNVIPEHSDRIIDINRERYQSLKTHRFGRSIKCDAVFTDQSNITLTTKPGDCTTAIIFCKRPENKDVIGIIHTGRRGVEVSLPQKTIRHIVKQYNCHVGDIHIGIVPHLFQINRKFENVDDLDKRVWKGFIEEKDGYFYPGETELAIKQYLDIGIKDENFYVYNVDTYEAASKGEAFSYKYHLEMSKEGKKVPEGRFIVAVMKH